MQVRYAVYLASLWCLAAAEPNGTQSVELSGENVKTSSPAPTTGPSITVPADIASYLSCYSEVTAWYNGSRTWWSTQERHPSLTTIATCTPQGTYTTLTTQAPVTTGTKYITLCDGIPRQVGQVTTITYPPSEITYTQTATCISYIKESNFPTPSPTCKGNCLALSSYFEAQGSSMDYGVCTNAMGYGYNCGQCVLTGKSARLLYWPQSTIPGSGDLCTEGKAVDATRTGNGPNTFVTGGLTLTSPTVGLALAGLGRRDGCFPTVAETILPFHPEAIHSVRGFRSWYSDWAFNFTDLNVQCLNNSTDQDDCFTAVPVTPYFYGLSRDATLDLGEVSTTMDRTIYNNYRPVIAPPVTLTEIFASVFGPGCLIEVDGVWDPPTALQQQTALPIPTLPATVLQASTSEDTPRSPVSATPTPAETSLKAVSATLTAVSDEKPSFPSISPALPSPSSASAARVATAASIISIDGQDGGQGGAVQPVPNSLIATDVGDTVSAQTGFSQTLSKSGTGASQRLLTTVAPGIGTGQTYITSAEAPDGRNAIATSQSAVESRTTTSAAVSSVLQISPSLRMSIYGGVILMMMMTILCTIHV